MCLQELVNALHAVEQRQVMRQETTTEGVMFVANKKKFQHQQNEAGNASDDRRRNFQRDKNFHAEKKNFRTGSSSRFQGKREPFPPCPHCTKISHTENFCWFRPDAQCKKCMQFGHVEKVCKNRSETNQ